MALAVAVMMRLDDGPLGGDVEREVMCANCGIGERNDENMSLDPLVYRRGETIDFFSSFQIGETVYEDRDETRQYLRTGQRHPASIAVYSNSLVRSRLLSLVRSPPNAMVSVSHRPIQSIGSTSATKRVRVPSAVLM